MDILSKFFNKRKKQNPGGKLGDIVAFHRYKALYIAIPKVANSSLKSLSVDILDEDIDKSLVNPKWKPSIFRNQEGRRYLRDQNILLDKTQISSLEGYWKFAFVRNPWDRLVSCYTEKIKSPDYNDKNFTNGVANILSPYGKLFYPGMKFEDFALAVCELKDEESDSHFRSQWSFLTLDNKPIANYIGKLENINQDLSTVINKCNFSKNLDLPHLLKSKDTNYSDFYNDNLINKVSERYHNDINNLNYDY